VIDRGPSFLSRIKGVKQEADGYCYVCITSVLTGLPAARRRTRAFRQVTPCLRDRCAL